MAGGAVEARRGWLVVVADVDGVKAYCSATIRCGGGESNAGNAQFRKEIGGWRLAGNVARIGAISAVAGGAVGVIRESDGLDTPVAKWRLQGSLGTVSEIARQNSLIALIQDQPICFARLTTNHAVAIATDVG